MSKIINTAILTAKTPFTANEVIKNGKGSGSNTYDLS